MQDFSEHRIQELALRAAVASRCRRAYLHDMRGGLQSISSSFELMNRAAQATPVNQAFVGKATEFFRRAIAAHEQVLDETLAGICGDSIASAPVALDEMGAQVLKFLQNDAAARQLSLRATRMEPATVPADRSALKLILLALITHAIDQAPVGASIGLAVESAPRSAVVLTAPEWAMHSDAFVLISTVGRRLITPDGGSWDAAWADASTLALRW